MVLAAVPEIVFAKKDGNLAKKTVFAIAQVNFLFTLYLSSSAMVGKGLQGWRREALPLNLISTGSY